MQLPDAKSPWWTFAVLGVLLATLGLVNWLNYSSGFDSVKDPRGMAIVALITGIALRLASALPATIPWRPAWMLGILFVLVITMGLVNTLNYSSGFDVVKDPRGMAIVTAITAVAMKIVAGVAPDNASMEATNGDSHPPD